MVTVNNRDPVEWREGLTVQDVLDALGYDYALITVTVNGELVAQEDYTSHLISDQAAVSVFHLAHGG